MGMFATCGLVVQLRLFNERMKSCNERAVRRALGIYSFDTVKFQVLRPIRRSLRNMARRLCAILWL